MEVEWPSGVGKNDDLCDELGRISLKSDEQKWGENLLRIGGGERDVEERRIEGGIGKRLEVSEHQPSAKKDPSAIKMASRETITQDRGKRTKSGNTTK